MSFLSNTFDQFSEQIPVWFKPALFQTGWCVRHGNLAVFLSFPLWLGTICCFTSIPCELDVKFLDGMSFITVSKVTKKLYFLYSTILTKLRGSQFRDGSWSAFQELKSNSFTLFTFLCRSDIIFFCAVGCWI